MSKYVIDNTTLTSIGNAIREKEGSSGAIKVSDFATRISAIEGGGGSGEGEGGLVLTGDISYAFSIRAAGNSYIQKLKSNLEKMYSIIFTKDMKTKDITNLKETFSGYDTALDEYPFITSIPFDLNIKDGEYASLYYTFYNQCYLTKPPKINGGIGNLNYAFTYCYRATDFDEAFANVEVSPDTPGLYYAFYNCRSMKRLPENLLKDCTNLKQYYGAFGTCYVLEEIKNLGVCTTTALTSNQFSNAFSNCSRLKSLTFATNDDGTPIKANWKSQVIDLTSYVGYGSSDTTVITTKYNSGLTNDTRINDATTYEALKDNPDSWTTLAAYSRYNRMSAVETINSLPDTSHYGTNTIKFKSSVGGGIDGGFMEDLTQEEIAVAAAKGWTVSLVS